MNTKCLMHKYKNTNTKYTNTTYDELPEIPNILYILNSSEAAILRKYFLILKNSNSSRDTNIPDSTGKYFSNNDINTNAKTRNTFIKIYTNINEKKTCTKLDRPQSLFDLYLKKKD